MAPGPNCQDAPGDFYVVPNCCALCGVPSRQAPRLIADCHEHSHCFIHRQPESADDVEAILSAIHLADLPCIRYRGTDSAVRRRLVETGVGEQCDDLPEDLRRRSEEVKAKILADEALARAGWAPTSPWRRFWLCLTGNAPWIAGPWSSRNRFMGRFELVTLDHARVFLIRPPSGRERSDPRITR